MIALYLDARLGAGSEEHISFFKLTTAEMSFEVEQRTPATASIGSQLNLFMEKKNYKDHREM